MKLSTILESTIRHNVYELRDLKREEPITVYGDVDLYSESITELSVKFDSVFGYFSCSTNDLSSFKGFPTYVKNHVNCSRNKLTSLEGAPSQIGTEFLLNYNKLTSLVGIHKIIKSCKAIHFSDNPIKEGGLGLLLIRDLNYIGADQPAFEIISKYLGKGKRGMIDCQTELIKAGYKEFAKI